MAAPPPASSKIRLEIDLTIVSAKHLKNVNWRHGDLLPYAVAWVDPRNRFPTSVDSLGGTKPVWSVRLPLSLSLPRPLSVVSSSSSSPPSLSIDVLHADSAPISASSKPVNPLVGSAILPLSDAPAGDSPRLVTLELRRPSGRPQGKIKIKIAVKEVQLGSSPPDYAHPPPAAPYSPSFPPPQPYLPPPSQSPEFRGGYSSYQYADLAYLRPNCHSGFYSQPSPFPPPPPPPVAPDYYGRAGYASGPSAPFDSSPSSSSFYGVDHAQKGKGSKMGFGTGLAVGAVAGTLGGLALDEGIKYEEEKASERPEKEPAPRDRYSEYHGDY
ncbi:protein SRC2-like [Nymphaea colorata]|uniref:protein SRC2-like n=1 Tax=Nymphaea colorata TaxID=210225 RepID=UPI00129E0D11|nr:protein SRC2-like [Nymphaea colorata]